MVVLKKAGRDWQQREGETHKELASKELTSLIER
jgi:hypothetical protein